MESGKFTKAPTEDQGRFLKSHYGAQFDSSGYTVSPGLCIGDEGAPLYHKRTSEDNGKDVFIITGIASTQLYTGLCGGLNNPSYFVRYNRVQ